MTEVMAFGEAVRLTRASERLGALIEPLTCVQRMIVDVRDAAPELDPEIREVEARLAEITEHVKSALGVLTAKVGLL